jgi:hypothetical protein
MEEKCREENESEGEGLDDDASLPVAVEIGMFAST